jgi:hypothetical protein
MLVIGLLAVLGLLLAPQAINSFRFLTFNEAADNIVGSLRKARDQSLLQKNDSAFGVKFFTDNYIVFQGLSYDTRDAAKDERHNISSNITASGISEITFAKNSGAPSITGIITLSNNNSSINIKINDHGLVEKE